MLPQTLGMMAAHPQAAGGMPAQSQASGGAGTQPHVFSVAGRSQQRPVPVALMVPSTPEHREDDTSTRGQLNPGFKFPG